MDQETIENIIDQCEVIRQAVILGSDFLSHLHGLLTPIQWSAAKLAARDHGVGDIASGLSCSVEEARSHLFAVWSVLMGCQGNDAIFICGSFARSAAFRSVVSKEELDRALARSFLTALSLCISPSEKALGVRA